MRTIKKSDIIFNLDPRHVYIEDFNAKFYTVNEADYSIEYSSEDVVTSLDGDSVKYSLNLDWKKLRNVGKGVLTFKCVNNIPSVDFPDGEYNPQYVQTTDYFIDTFEVEPAEVENYGERLDELEEEVDGKQDTLVSGVNIKTINHQSLLGSGNINIQGGGGDMSDYYTKEEVDAIASGKADTSTTYTKSETDSALNTKQNTLVSGSNIKTINGNSLLGSGNISIEGADMSNYYTRTEINTALATKANVNSVYSKEDTYNKSQVDTALSGKQATLVSGTNIKTVNGNSLLGSGNITIEGGGDMSDYYTKEETDAIVSGKANSDDVYTKTQVSKLLSAKADTATTYTKTDVDLIASTKQAVLVNTVNIKSINGYSLLGSGNITIEGGGGGGDLTNYYTKTETDILLDTKANTATTYTKTEVDAAVSGKANSSDVYTTGQTYTKSEVDNLIEDIDLTDYYTKSQVDSALAGKANTATTYTKTEVDSAISSAVSGKADSNDVYTKSQVDSIVSGKADSADVYTTGQTYTKTEVDNALAAKANTATTYTKTEVDAAVSGKANSADVYTTGQTYTKTEVDNLIEHVDLTDYYTKEETNAIVSGKADSSAVTEEISAAVSGKADSSDVYTTGNTYSKSEVDTALADKANTATTYSKTEVDTVLADYFDDAVYELSGTTHVINFYHGNAVKATIVADDFIKDGMVSNVVISGGNLVISFNTDAGQEPISIPLTDIFNPANYYTKSEVDAAISGKANSTDVTTEINAAVSGKADSADVYTTGQTYTKSEVDTALAGKQATLVSGNNIKSVNGNSLLGSGDLNVNNTVSLTQAQYNALTPKDPDTLYIISDAPSVYIDDYYTKTEVDAAVSGKADSADVYTTGQTYTKSEVDNLIEDIDLTDYYTKSQVDSALAGKSNTATTYTKTEVDSAITSAVSGKADSADVYTTGQTYTKTEVDTALSAKANTATTYTKTEVDAAVSGKADSSAVTQEITAAVSGKADSSDVYTTGQTYSKTEVDTALSAKANTATTYTKTEVDTALNAKANTATTYTKTETDTALSGKQDTLVSGTNIKTVNGNSLLGSGNITIEGGGGSGTIDPTLDSGSTNAVANSAITTAINSISGTVSGKTVTVSLTQAQYDALAVKDSHTLYVISDASDVDISNYYTKTEVDTSLAGKANTATTYTKTEVDTAVSSKQDTLVSGTNIKTINGTSILGSGNIVIEGGGGGGDLTNYYTKSEVYNKAEIDEAERTIARSLTDLQSQIGDIELILTEI